MTTPNRSLLSRRAALSLGITAVALFSSSTLTADTLYWNGAVNTPWTTASNWSTDAAGTIPGTVPTASDNLIFKSDPLNATAGQVSIGANVSANSLTFTGTQTMRLSQGGTRNLSLGAGGITLNSGVGGITIGESQNSLYTDATASQTWINNSSSGLSVRRLRAADSATGDVTVTLSANGTGSFTFANTIEDSLDGLKKLSLVIDSAGTGGATLLTGGWTGGTTVKRGLLNTSAATIGAGNVKLGDTSGSATATLRINSNTVAFTSSLIVQANSGTNSLEFTSATTGGTVNSTITLDGDLTVGVRSTAAGSFINGAISGSGDLIKGQYQGSNTTGLLTLGGINTYSGDTLINVGAFTLADNAALTFYIGGDGENNQVSGAGTNSATFAGDFNFNLLGADLEDGNSWLIVDIATLSESFSSTFSVIGFNDGDLDNIWTNGSGFSFDESTGVLSYAAVPEPSSIALLGGLGALAVVGLRRRRSRVS